MKTSKGIAGNTYYIISYACNSSLLSPEKIIFEKGICYFGLLFLTEEKAKKYYDENK